MKKESLANKLINVFKINKYTYTTNQPIEKLRDKINFLINQKGIINFKYNLTGNLNSDDTFKLSRRAGLIVINDGTGGPPVTIKGKLIEEAKFKTNIEIVIKPNWVLVIMPIIFGLIAITLIMHSIITNNKENLFGGIFFITIPLFWALIKFTKNYYKSEFENALDLTNFDMIRED